MLAALCSGQVVRSSTPAPVSEVKGVVTDAIGAVIQHSEVVFKGDSGTIVSHTGDDGSVTVHLPSGTYSVTIASQGFVTAKLVDFRISAPTPAAFRVALEVDRTAIVDFPRWAEVPQVPTVTADFPWFINPTPAQGPAPQLANKKSRSLKCLYLWRCALSPAPVSIGEKSPSR